MYFTTTFRDANGLTRRRGQELEESHGLTDDVIETYRKRGWLTDDAPDMPQAQKPLQGGGGRPVKKGKGKKADDTGGAKTE